mgnify:CR=1 FL=1
MRVAQVGIELQTPGLLEVGRPMTEFKLAAFGGTAPYTWSLAGPVKLPAGLTLDPAQGTIRGTPEAPGSFALDLSSFSNRDQVASLKQALAQGAETAVKNLAKENGFLGNDKVRIPLPENLQKVDGLLRKFGMGKYADELVVSMNRAAEAAVPEAKTLLVGAVKKMTVDEKIAFWRWVMQYAKDRGIECYVMTWNIFTYGTEGNSYGITDAPGNATTKDYFRKSVRALPSRNQRHTERSKADLPGRNLGRENEWTELRHNQCQHSQGRHAQRLGNLPAGGLRWRRLGRRLGGQASSRREFFL